MHKNQEKIDKSVRNCFKELYNNCTTPVDFDSEIFSKKSNNAFMNYEISKKDADEIIAKHFRLSRLPKHLEKAFINTIYLGPSPRFIIEDND